MNYVLLAASFVFFAIILSLARFVFKKAERVLEIVVGGLLIVVFLGRFYCYLDVQVSGEWLHYTQLWKNVGGFEGASLFFGEMCLWFGMGANLFLLMRPFSKQKSSSWFVKFISLPIIVVSIICMNPMIKNMIGEQHSAFETMKVVEYLLPLELGGTLAFSVYYFVKDFKVKLPKVDRLHVGLFASLGMFAVMPPFIPAFFFGAGNPNTHPLDLVFQHRLLIYVLLIFAPLLIYFLLRRHSKDRIRYCLIFISLGVMFNFCFMNKYDCFLYPWKWPFHLCNTAVFVVPFCFIFKPKRLFYFTYFINVFGALLAMLMPNYSETITIFNPDVWQFWYNHALAFWMPLLGVALKLYDRPKLKQYFYSSIWFLGYYILVFVLNTVFTAYGHQTDFFFINSNFIADKFGTWANQVFNKSLSFTIGNVQFVIRPIYQSIYFITYLIIGFGVWFVYQLGFDIADSHQALHIKLKGIRQDKIALDSVLDGRSIEEPMDKDAGIKLELDHFSKKYGANKHYSVHDVSFEVKAGEVFGFLGPNGAGKSTIIKSLVGIQPITEGKMRICGFDVQTQSVQAKSLVGFVPDHYALYEKLTGREYINYIADIFQVSQKDRDERITYYVKLFELEASIDNKIKTYSHGMKQKITIISALVHEPKVWILDEPLTGLDPTSIYQVKQCMKHHAEKGNIVFFSSHLIDVVEKLCDRVGIIKLGELQAVDTVKNIEDKHGSLEKYYLEIIGDNVTKAGE